MQPLKKSEQENSALQDFVKIATHDLKAPLRHILFFTNQILEESDRNSDQAQSDLNRILNSTKRMNSLIEDLSDYIKFEITPLNYEPADLNDLLHSAQANLQREIQESEAEIITEKMPEIRADKRQIRKLFCCLLDNSLKFLEKDQKPVIKINCKEDSQKKTCQISIEDNGIGFKEEYQDKIFEPFQRLHPPKEYQGSGMGLAIAKKIIERHQGTIEALGKEDQGAIFTIQLPYGS